MNTDTTTKNSSLITYIIFSCTALLVLLSLVSVIFPALIISHFGSIQNSLDQFEIGNNAFMLIGVNLLVFGLGFVYYKRYSSQFSDGLDKLRGFDISKKTALIVTLVILLIYVGFTFSELYLDESKQFPDYYILTTSLKLFPSIDTGDVYFDEQNSRFVRMLLLGVSQNIFDNIKIIPFISSILLLVFTCLVTISISKKRIAGIFAMIILMQGHTFLEYDTIAVYENIWVLFFLLSIYTINRRWYLSGFWYIMSVFTKAFSVPFLALNIFFILRENLPTSYKIKIISSYVVSIALVFGLFFIGETIYDDFIDIDFNRFVNSLTAFSSQMRFDYLLLFTILPVIVGLFFLRRNGIKHADSLLFFIFSLILVGPLVSLVTDFYSILPYRFLPLIVFFSISVALIIFKRN